VLPSRVLQKAARLAVPDRREHHRRGVGREARVRHLPVAERQPLNDGGIGHPASVPAQQVRGGDGPEHGGRQCGAHEPPPAGPDAGRGHGHAVAVAGIRFQEKGDLSRRLDPVLRRFPWKLQSWMGHTDVKTTQRHPHAPIPTRA
jgi:hypothetical protein